MTARALLVILLAATSVGACSSSDLNRAARPTTLEGTVWRVVTINGRPPVAGSEPTAAFAAAEVKGSSGCNSYSGQYTYDAATGAIAFGDMIGTTAACAEPGRMDIESAFSRAMGAATVASINVAGRLVLSGPGGEIVLTVDAVQR